MEDPVVLTIFLLELENTSIQNEIFYEMQVHACMLGIFSSLVIQVFLFEIPLFVDYDLYDQFVHCDLLIYQALESTRNMMEYLLDAM